jgi:hypothetical protein
MRPHDRFLLVLFLASACAAPKPLDKGGSAPRDAPTRVLAIGEAIVKQRFEENPLTVALLRPPGSTYERLPDDSLAAIAVRRTQRHTWLTELRQIVRRELAGSPSAELTYDIAVDDLDADAQYEICHPELWAVSQTANGWQIGLASLAEA